MATSNGRNGVAQVGSIQHGSGICIPSPLAGVWVQVVVNVFLHLGLRSEATPTVGHGTAERTITLDDENKLIKRVTQDPLITHLVRPRVLVENSLLSKVLTALAALVRLLARMDSNVLMERMGHELAVTLIS